METCGSCGEKITVCTACEGKRCTDGCIDRIDDGCTCEETEEDDVVTETDE